jgi:CHAT domain-containing protein
LVQSGNAECAALLAQYSALADVELAYALKEICYEAFTVEPARSVLAATALASLAELNPSEEIASLARWAAAIGALVQGQMELAIGHLDVAESKLLALGNELAAATTQLSKLIALAMLGRYQEAITCGLRAREVFLAHDDVLSAGRIENNIGNLYFRREHFTEAEKFQSLARDRFIKIKVDQKQLAIINNCLANTHAVLHKFRSAEELYQQAEQQAESAGLSVTLAEIESNIGTFALLQGRYDRALDYLERSRRRYASLGMEHQSIIAEQEMADAYLELNLALEASGIYEQIIPKFENLGLRAEQARSLANLGRAEMLLGKFDEATERFKEAGKLYRAEGNEVGAAMVSLSQAQVDYQQGRITMAGATAAEVETSLAQSGSWSRLLLARWLRGEAKRAQHDLPEAEVILRQTLSEAIKNQQPQVAERCHTSLGLLAAAQGSTALAESEFLSAVGLIEELRAPLPGEEFRTAFFADKLTPYAELVRLCLDGRKKRVAEAFQLVERARARSLIDSITSNLVGKVDTSDPFEHQLRNEQQNLQQELNYFYHQLERPALLSRDNVDELRAGLLKREQQTSEIMRRLQHRKGGLVTSLPILNVEDVQRALGPDSALIEYTTIDDQLSAFLITNKTVEVVRHLGSEAEITAELVQFRFQIDALRHGSERMRRHLPDLTRRARLHLEKLYDYLLRKIEPRIGSRRLVIVPQRALHYLPFQALHDGDGYVVERREVSYAPSAAVLLQCLRRANRGFDKALLIGVADELIPKVRNEIHALAPLFSEAVTLLDGDATVAALARESQAADIVHLACHGQFRPDNPLFSSLRLGDGWLTVRDTYNLKLQCELVTLSACETGLNQVAPGEELIGLARGFVTAGAPSLLLSLWTVDDEATGETMTRFYSELGQSRAPAHSLREAQLAMMKSHPHPFFWSPFVLMGRW